FRVAATTHPRPLPTNAGLSGEKWQEIQGKINGALDRAVAFLIRTQQLDGSWAFFIDAYPSGQTALATYALLKCGVAPARPVIRRAVEFLKAHPPRRTYSMACHILALCALNDGAYRPLIDDYVAQLVLWQREGGFGYPDGAVDLSNTQYAALALHTAAETGIEVPVQVWQDLADRVLLHQRGRQGTLGAAGFSYHPGGAPSGSMTAAGVAVVEICEKHLPRTRPELGFAKRCGLEWLARNFSATTNPVEGAAADSRWLFYYLYGLERVGGLTGLSHFGAHNWYREGAEFLVGTQKGGGAWDEGAWGSPYGELEPNTCFSMLFLARATSAVTGRPLAAGSSSYGKEDPDRLVSLRLSGDCPLLMWIGRFGNQVLSAFEWPGEKGQGLRVHRIDYYAWPEAESEPGEEDEPVAIVFGDENRPAGFERFPARYTFPRPGKYIVRATAVIALPPAERSEKPGRSYEELCSDPIAVGIQEGFTEELLEYASDGPRNLLPGGRVTVQASSEFSGDWRAAFVADNVMARAWLSQDGDPTPSLGLTLENPARADTLLLTHTYQSTDKERTSRVKRVRILVNSQKPGHEITMIPDDRRKTVLEFPKPVFVKRLDVQVLERTPGHPTKNAVGFTEIELQYRKAKGGKVDQGPDRGGR
ncbi:MAG: hypothetical protein AB1486_29735, partial [Planctomycetota bacterium]